MKADISRRQFLASAAAVTAAVAAGTATAAAEHLVNLPSHAARPNNNRMKIGLYTITYLGIWYEGEGMKLKDVMQHIKAGLGGYRARHEAPPCLTYGSVQG